MPRGIYQHKSQPPEERFEKHYVPVPESGCWLWVGAIQENGYGRFYIDGKMVQAHRYAYEQKHGLIPEGLELDHLCRVRLCVNPDHLEPVTRKENLSRGINANSEKSHCPKGHHYSGENLYTQPDGRRGCRACGRQNSKKYRMNKNKANKIQEKPRLPPQNTDKIPG